MMDHVSGVCWGWGPSSSSNQTRTVSATRRCQDWKLLSTCRNVALVLDTVPLPVPTDWTRGQVPAGTTRLALTRLISWRTMGVRTSSHFSSVKGSMEYGRPITSGGKSLVSGRKGSQVPCKQQHRQ